MRVWSAAALPPLSNAPEARSALCKSGGRAAALHLLLLLFSLPIFASTSTSAITGRVKSEGRSAAGVTVTVTSPALLGERTTTTTRNGRYWLTALPPGRYDVTFSRAKLQTLTRRVVVELSRVSRADAVLEPSEDEDSITSTALPLTVADTTVINSHFSDDTFDRLPLRRDPYTARLLAPGPFGPMEVLVNDATSISGELGVESLEQVTVLRGAIPAEYGSPDVVIAKTRSGGENYFFSLRDSITAADWMSTDIPNFEALDNGIEQTVELNAGGRVFKDWLWFFAGGWNGSEFLHGDRAGYEAKLDWHAAPQHNFMLFASHAEVSTQFFSPESAMAALRYTGTAGPRWTTEAVAARSTTDNSQVAQPIPIERFTMDSLFLKSTYVTGDHILSGGGQWASHTFDDEPAFFVNDRWRIQRVTFNAGARYEYDQLSPRIAATYDVKGNGRQAITASLSDYADPQQSMRELAFGFATAVGTTGSIRVDAFRRDYGIGEDRGVAGEFRYSLFDRFHTGASYTWTEPGAFSLNPEHMGHAWAGVDIPVGEHELGITAMEHFRSRFSITERSNFQTDVALRYSLPLSRTRLTVALDTRNLFDRREQLFSFGRSFEGWLRLRL
jgi:hypothetical protein